MAAVCQDVQKEAIRMTGADKIISCIEEDAQKQAHEILAEAEAKAAALLEQAQEQATQRRVQAKDSAEKQAQAIIRTAHSGAALTVRNALLLRRRELIDAAMDEAADYIRQLPDDSYFAELARLAREYALPGEGVVRLGAGDLARMPAGFMQTIQPVQGTLRLAEEPAPFEGGLRLEYGEIEIDLSLDALRTARREELEDLLSRELFAEE